MQDVLLILLVIGGCCRLKVVAMLAAVVVSFSDFSRVVMMVCLSCNYASIVADCWEILGLGKLMNKQQIAILFIKYLIDRWKKYYRAQIKSGHYFNGL